jgi:Cu/Ag efflux pump CusA
MIPLIIAEGAGAKSRIAIGMVIAFGMFIGTLFTLFVTPAIYTFVARDHRAGRGHAEEEPVMPTLAPAHAAE